MNNKLTRSANEMFFGVAAGIGEHLNIDTTIVRAAWVLATLFIGPEVALVYLGLAMFLKKPAANNVSHDDIIIEKDPASVSI